MPNDRIEDVTYTGKMQYVGTVESTINFKIMLGIDDVTNSYDIDVQKGIVKVKTAPRETQNKSVNLTVGQTLSKADLEALIGISGLTANFSGKGTYTLEDGYKATEEGTAELVYTLESEDLGGDASYEYGIGIIKVAIEVRRVIPMIIDIVEGANQEWTKGTTTGLIVTSNADFANFTEVKVDGVAVDATNYDVVSGSTKVTLKPAYLETLAVGTHTLDIVSSNGTASTSFTIKAAAVTPGGTTPGGTTPGGTTGGNSNTGNKPNPNTGATSPQTGDNSNMYLWIALLAASACGLASTLVISKRKRAK